MPNPVAEVVERLNAEIEAAVNASGPGMPAGAAMRQLQFLLEDARNLIERLSRERDTGVPEGWQLVPKEPASLPWVTLDARGNGITITQEQWTAMLSAAPQPPTVSPDIDALTRERDQAREALAERQWLLSQAPEHRRPGDESIPPVRADASQAACEIIADILRIGSDVGPNGEIIISDAARFRMAHRLAHIAETGVLVDEAPSAEVPA